MRSIVTGVVGLLIVGLLAQLTFAKLGRYCSKTYKCSTSNNEECVSKKCQCQKGYIRKDGRKSWSDDICVSKCSEVSFYSKCDHDCFGGECTCLPGYTLQPNGFTCKTPCELAGCQQQCQPPQTKLAAPTCYCNKGYKVVPGDSTRCTKDQVDKCANVKCDTNEECKNGACQCKNGYNPSFGGTGCEAGNPCDYNNGGCGSGGICFQTQPGKSECICMPPQKLSPDGKTCVASAPAKCTSPQITANSLLSCSSSDSAVGTTCTYRCKAGYTHIPGSKSVISCKASGGSFLLSSGTPQWDGTPLSCNIDLDECSESPSVCPQVCINTVGSYTCDCFPGYVSDSTNTCKDTVSPTLETCQSAYRLSAAPSKGGATVTWKPPTYSDNSGKVTVSGSVASPHYFPIGQHSVVYTGQDAAGNKAPNCVISITVQDNERPVFTSCPSTQRATVKVNTERAILSYADPVATDNSGRVNMRSSGVSQWKDFELGRHTVRYTAVDASGNEAVCSFNVIISFASCPSLPFLLNGYHNCSSVTVGESCSVACNGGYSLSPAEATQYTCTGSLSWSPSSQLPTCLGSLPPTSRMLTYRLIYVKTACSQEEFKAAFNQFVWPNDQLFCYTGSGCSLKSLEVTCGDQDNTVNVVFTVTDSSLDFVQDTDAALSTIQTRLAKASKDNRSLFLVFIKGSIVGARTDAGGSRVTPSWTLTCPQGSTLRNSACVPNQG